MRIYRNAKVEKLVEEKAVCNRCGAEATPNLLLSGEEVEAIHQFRVSFGYDSKYDGELWKFDLCEDCIEEIVNTFKVPVEKNDYL
jgi:hypothetical protein